MAVSQSQDKLTALYLSTVTNTNDFQFTSKAGADTQNHIVQQSTTETMQRTCNTAFIFAGNNRFISVNLNGYFRTEHAAQFTQRTFYLYQGAIGGRFDFD